MTQVRLFGGPRLLVDGRDVDLGHPTPRRVLAVLAMGVGLVVPVDVLVERVWDGTPPRTARGSLQAHVTRVRTVLRQAGAPMTVQRRDGGYFLETDPATVDVAVFRALRGRAGALTPGSPERAALLERALQVATAPALTGVSGAWADRVRVGLDQEKLNVVLAWAGDRLRLGHHDVVISRLHAAREAFPRVEPLAELLIRSLHAAGRNSEAIEVYLGLRRRLLEDLGSEPGSALAGVYGALLRGDLQPLAVGTGHGAGTQYPNAIGSPNTIAMDGGTIGPASVPSGAPDGPATGARLRTADTSSHPHHRGSSPVPRQLPAVPGPFVGRARELATLGGWLVGDAEAAVADGFAGRGSTSHGRGAATGGPSFCVVAGMAGVGKSALAVRCGHRLAARFADGQIYLNLRGYDQVAPMTSGDALARLLQTLGVPGPQIPAGTDERAALFRTRAAGRRLLILLDNALSADQVRPLLPGSPGCAVIVTSRAPLTGLVARDGALRLDLDALPFPEAVGLLHRLLGPRADTDPDSVVELARRCQGLPLALRVAAERAAAGSGGESLRDLVKGLDSARHTLDLLDASGDPLTAVRAVFSWSCQHLPPATARVFRLLGVVPGGHADVAGVAALCGLDVGRSRQHLDRLLRAQLVQPSSPPEQVTMHDLLRAYAAEWAGEVEGEPGIRSAQVRFLDHYLATATAAMDVVAPHEADLRRAFGAPSATSEPSLTAEHAAAWLHRQARLRREIIAFAATASPTHAFGLAALFAVEMQVTGPRSELRAVFDTILVLARAHDRPVSVVLALTMVATGAVGLGDRDLAQRCLDEAEEDDRSPATCSPGSAGGQVHRM